MTTKPLTKTKARADGDRAEMFACGYLQNRGLQLLQSNFNCRFGEIDLIMHDYNAIVFVEVRSRQNNNFGGAAASVDTRKRSKLLAAGAYYLQQKELTETVPCRFDVVTITTEPKHTVEWIKDAFRLD